MNNTSKFSSLTALSAVAALALAACAGPQESTSTTITSTSTSSASSATTAASSEQNTTSSISYDTHFDADDISWDESAEKTIDLSNPEATDGVTVEDGVLTITAAGDYRLSGTYEGQIVVNAGDEDMVRLILDNVTITNDSGSALNVQNANEVVIYTASGTENTVTDGKSYEATGEEDPNAALYSKADLTLAGEGTLKVEGNYADAIATADGLVIASGTYEVTATDDGIKGKDYVDIQGGTIKVAAGGDGIKSTNAEDEERGWSRMTGGDVTVSATDDGFKSEKELEITAGSLNITESTEGIEGQYITISGGEVNVVSSDDGLNATESDTTSDTADEAGTDTSTEGFMAPDQRGMGGGMGGPGGEEVADATVTITGGTLTLNAEGDGFDSNGTASLTGGTVIVNGPSSGGNGSTDVAGDFTLDGATLLTGGTADMFVAPSGQAYLKVTDLSSTVSEGDEIQVQDSAGKTVATYTVTAKGAQLIFISAPDMTAGDTYTLVSGNTTLGDYTAE